MREAFERWAGEIGLPLICRGRGMWLNLTEGLAVVNDYGESYMHVKTRLAWRAWSASIEGGIKVRQAFERWAVVEGLPVNKGPKKAYLNVKTRLAWRAWKAGAQYHAGVTGQ